MAIQPTLDKLKTILAMLDDQHFDMVADCISSALLSDDPLDWYCAVCFAELALELQRTY